MGTFKLLSPNIQKKIWNMKWEAFTPIQEKAIPSIIETKQDVILSSGTASGKTEAAFLPILSMVEKEAEENLKVIYISPLKALINNQYERIINLSEYTNIPIHRWHGDISQSKKKKFTKNPSGILQITPESIESLFVNRTEQLYMMFKDLDFIVIDEIHSFLDDERGVHLRSLLHRIENYSTNKPRMIGLSATLDNFAFVQGWVNYDNPANVNIIESPGSDKDLLYSLMHFPSGKSGQKPLELFEDMRDLTKEQKGLIFSNSRGGVEEGTVMLNRLAKKEGVKEETYYAHHSSINKEEREYVEKKMAESSYPRSVLATSSLELGIDVGEIDIVVQLDSTFTVSSLKQRLGRSGRKQEASQYLQLYSTSDDSLLQSLAVMELVKEKWVEPAIGYPVPYDILFHQILSICKETNGIQKGKLLEYITNISIFHELEVRKIDMMISFMLENEHLEMIKGPNELIIGLEGERLLRGKEFYSVFMTTEQFEVLQGVKSIGTIDKIMLLNEGDNLILSGKLWKIMKIDTKRNKVYVQKAVDGKPPKYLSGGQKIHKKIGEKMIEILCSDESFEYADEEAVAALNDIRVPYHANEVTYTSRIIWGKQGEMVFETFTGTNIVKTLVWMLRSRGFEIKMPDGLGRIKLPHINEIMEELEEIKRTEWKVEELNTFVKEGEKFSSKFIPYLPEELQYEMHVAHEFDIEGVREFLNEHTFKVVQLY